MLLAVWAVPHVVLIQLFWLLELGHAAIQVNLFICYFSSVAIWEFFDICQEQEVLLFLGDILMPGHVQNHFLFAPESLFVFEETIIALLVDFCEQLGHSNLFSEGHSAVVLLVIIAEGIRFSVTSYVPDP